MKKETKAEIIWMAIITIILFVLFFGCGSKKTISEVESKEKIELELSDKSTINSKVEQERQLVNTSTKERIVTYYGVRFDTIYQKGQPYSIPVHYPVKTEEERDIESNTLLDKLSTQDSIHKNIELKYKSDLAQKDKQISEFKETKTLYHAALIVLGAGLLLLLFLRR